MKTTLVNARTATAGWPVSRDIDRGRAEPRLRRANYAAAFDWEFNDYGPDYAGIKGGSGEVGGLARSEDERPGGPLVVLFSDNLEASLEAVNAAGGRIVKEIFSFPGGRRFHFADPSGNELAVWSPNGD